MSKKTLSIISDSFPGTALPNAISISDVPKITELVSQAANQLYRASLKLTGSDIVFKASLLGWDPKTEGFEVGLSLEDTKAFVELSKKLKTREVLVIIFVGNRHMLGAQTDYYENDTTVLRLNLPAKLIKLQRRKSVRYEIPAGYDLTIEIDSIETAKRRTTKNIFDISEGGLSIFVLSLREASLYRKGSILKNSLFKIRNQELRADLQVCNSVPVDRGSKGEGTKIGTEFVKISADDRDFITQYVYSQISQMLS